MKQKIDFVKKLKNFYIDAVHNPMQIADMTYVFDNEKGEEWIYIIYPEAQQRVCITMDDLSAILSDFMNYVNNHDKYKWLKKEEWI